MQVLQPFKKLSTSHHVKSFGQVQADRQATANFARQMMYGETVLIDHVPNLTAVCGQSEQCCIRASGLQIGKLWPSFRDMQPQPEVGWHRPMTAFPQGSRRAMGRNVHGV